MARGPHRLIALLLAVTLAVPVGWADTGSEALHRGEPVSRWHGRWYVASSAALGFDSERLATAISNIGRMRGVQGFLLARSGYLVEEHYWRGGARDKPHNLKSASKGIISALVGIAISKGYFRLDQPIADLLPQARLLKDPVKEGITVHQLLTMTSGLESTSYEAYNDWVRNRDWITAALQQPLAALPGTEYRYSTGNTHLLSAVLAASTGTTTREFAEQKLFEPMGVFVAGWQRDPKGIHLGGNNFSLLPRDAAKIGQLYLDDGRWRDQQLVPKSWIAASTRPTDNGPHETYGNYGFLWWTQPPEDGSFAAVGYGGQYILVSPRHDSVVVVLSNAVSKGDYWEARLFELLKRGVLGSLVDPSMPPAILLAVPNGTNRSPTREPVTAIAAANVNLRAEPSLSAKRLALIPEGSQLELLERDDEWVRGRINGQAGWLHWDYIDWLSLQSEESELTPVANRQRVTKRDSIAVGQPDVASTNRWTIIDGTTREQADRANNSLQTRGSILGEDKTLVALLKSRFDRVRVQVQDLRTLLRATSYPPRYRTTTRINFRGRPGLNGRWLMSIDPETEFQVLGDHGPWLKAKIDGVEGWLHSDFVIAVEPTAEVSDQTDLVAELSVVGESVRKLLARQRLSESEVADAKRHMEDMEHELEGALARQKEVDLERARLDRDHQAKAEELIIARITQQQRAQELDTARTQIVALEDSLQKEQSAKQALATDLIGLREGFQSNQDQLALYAAAQKQRGREIDAARTRIAAVEESLQQEQSSKRSLADELAHIRDQSDAQRQQFEQLVAEQAQRTRKLDVAHTRIAKLEGVLQQEQSSKRDLVDELGRIRDQSGAQRQQLEQLVAEQAQRTQKLDVAHTRIAKLEGVLQQEQSSKRDLVDELGRIRDQSGAQRQQLEQLEADQAQRTQKLDVAHTRIAELEGVLQQEQTAKLGLAGDLARLRDEYQTQRQQFALALRQEQASKRTLTDELVRLDAEHQTLSRQLDEFAAAEQQRTEELKTTRGRVIDLEHTVQQQRTEKQALADDLMRLSRESRTQNQRLEHLDAVSKQSSDELVAARAKLAELERLRSHARELADQRSRTESRDVTMSEQLEQQGAGWSTTAESLITASVAATTPTLKAKSAKLDATADIDALVYGWAAAWSKQDIDAYLAYYSAEFQPPGGATLMEWETLRRHRLARPSFIEVSIAELEVTLSGPGRAQATFHQAYRADRYQDKVLKTLELMRESDQWRIVHETSH